MEENKMITLKFPKLEKALTKQDKTFKDDDPRKGVIVFRDNAIVFTHYYCLVVNLKDYFRNDCDITDETELRELRRILFFMNAKTFNKEFWEELTKGANMKMDQGNLYIENPRYAKHLHYKEIEINHLPILETLIIANNLPSGPTSVISLPYGALISIAETLKADFKNDHIIMEFSGADKFVRFTFRNRKHFYGIIMPHFDSAQEGFRFEYLNNFMNDEFIKETVAELREIHKPKLPPPPPKTVETAETEGDLFKQEFTTGNSWSRSNPNE